MGPVVFSIASFVAGAILGILNFRGFVNSVRSLDPEAPKSGLGKQVVKAGIFRHVFVFFAGICLIRVASLPPIPLCAGLLVGTFVCRLKTWRGFE